jgi:hypothetical protein
VPTGYWLLSCHEQRGIFLWLLDAIAFVMTASHHLISTFFVDFSSNFVAFYDAFS